MKPSDLSPRNVELSSPAVKTFPDLSWTLKPQGPTVWLKSKQLMKKEMNLFEDTVHFGIAII